MADRIFFVDLWYNEMVRLRTRPSELVPLTGLLYGWEGAQERWERYLEEKDAWDQKGIALREERLRRLEELPSNEEGK